MKRATWALLVLLATPMAGGVFPLGDRVWQDSDGDGLQDAGELGLGGVTVHLYENATCAGRESMTTTSAPDGSYQLDYGCRPDKEAEGICEVCLEFVLPDPASYEFSPADQGSDDTVDSDVDAQGRAGNLTVGTGPNLTIDAGAVPIAIPVTLTRFTVDDGGATR